MGLQNQHRRALTTSHRMAPAPGATTAQLGASPQFHALLAVFATPLVHHVIYLVRSLRLHLTELPIVGFEPHQKPSLFSCLRRSVHGELLCLSCRSVLLHWGSEQPKWSLCCWFLLPLWLLFSHSICLPLSQGKSSSCMISFFFSLCSHWSPSPALPYSFDLTVFLTVFLQRSLYNVIYYLYPTSLNATNQIHLCHLHCLIGPLLSWRLCHGPILSHRTVPAKLRLR